MGSLVLLLLFVASAAVIWIAGIKLSDTTDVLAERLHPGRARAAGLRSEPPLAVGCGQLDFLASSARNCGMRPAPKS
ncbi:hypothetical protein GCM10010524_00500 [Streptomyces mexicanus]